MEYRMKCDVCGNIFCYTDEDLKKNDDNAKMATMNALGGVLSALGGTTLQTHHLQGQANHHGSKIVDYNQCPHCHSRSISVYTGDDTKPMATNAPVAATKNINTSASAESLLKRAFIFLEDEEWETADAYCEACLDKDPELAEAYLGKLMAELRVKTQAELKNLEKPFYNNVNYKKIVRFANDKLKNTLNDYLVQIQNRNEDARKDDILRQAKSKMTDNTIYQYEEAIPLLASIAGWKDADEQKTICHQKLAELRRKAEEARVERERLAELERQRTAQAEQKAQERKLKNKKILIKYGPIAAGILVVILMLFNVVIPGVKLFQADKLVKAGQFDEAIEAYSAMEESEKRDNRINAAYYAHAESLLAQEEYELAINKFRSAGNYEDAKQRIFATYYAYAESLLVNKEFEKAVTQFQKAGDYEDAKQRISATYYAYAEDLLAREEFEKAVSQFKKAGGYSDALQRISNTIYAHAEYLVTKDKFDQAITQFESLGNYKDAPERIKHTKYVRAERQVSSQQRYTAYLQFMELGSYSDAKEQAAQLKAELEQALSIELVYFNTEKSNYSKVDSSIPNDTSYLHYGFKVNGLYPGEEIELVQVYQWPGEEKKIAEWTWEDVKSGELVENTWKNGYEPDGSGSLKVEIHIYESQKSVSALNNPVGQFSMKVQPPVKKFNSTSWGIGGSNTGVSSAYGGTSIW